MRLPYIYLDLVGLKYLMLERRGERADVKVVEFVETLHCFAPQP